MKRRELLARSAALVVAGTVGGCALSPQVVQDGDPAYAGPRVPAGTSLSQIAFASCIDQTKPQPIWDAILAGKPDLFIFGGDTVYAKDQPWSVEPLRRAYATEAAVPGFARLRREIPHLAIWDDGDYGLDDGGANFPFKADAKAEFLQFWNLGANDPRRGRDGLYHAQVFGRAGQRVQVILLDARWFRSPWKPTDRRNAPGKERYLPDPDPAKTMLGEAQWQWLEEQLRQPADMRLIVSGIQVVANGHGWECWANFPLERARLYRLIATTRAAGVVFLSGDRHFGAFYREVDGAPYPLYEMTSSGMTHPWREANEAGPNRLAMFTELHYGTVDIDWAARSLTLALRDVRGATQRSQSIPFDELRP